LESFSEAKRAIIPNIRKVGYAYLPQEVITQKTYESYIQRLSEVCYEGIQFQSNPFDEGCFQALVRWISFY